MELKVFWSEVATDPIKYGSPDVLISIIVLVIGK
jgi:hypothetical protein